MTKALWLTAITSIALFVVYGSAIVQSTGEKQLMSSAVSSATDTPSSETTLDASVINPESQDQAAEEQQTRNLNVPDNVEPNAKGAGIALFNFERPEPAWFTVDDNVMGGISSSSITINESLARLTFSGTVSLENNGGFASARSQWVPYDLSGFDGIALRVRGDGNDYQLRIRTEDTGRDIAYTAMFETEADTWTAVFIPFEDMVPLYRGFIVNAAGPLNPAAIRSFGLMITDKQVGEFMLEVDWINVIARNERLRSAALSENLPNSG
jgi:monofunctional biosynthetic peptidoglycan transglycosylase